MSGKYTSEIFKTGAELDEALQAALNAKSNATIAEKSAASAESAAKTAEDSAAAAVEAGRYVEGAAEGVQNAINNIPPGETPVVNDLTTGGVTMALSAEQGKVLKSTIDGLTAADVGAAPAGYGFGETLAYIVTNTVEELCSQIDEVLSSISGDKAKLVQVLLKDITGTSGAVLCVIHKFNTNNASIMAMTGYDNDGTDCWRIAKKNGVWQSLEWFNPPMQLGVEYRTTERFNGKPVYAKAVDCGTLPVNSIKNAYAGTAGANAVVRTHGTIGSGVGATDLMAWGGVKVHTRVANANGEILIQFTTTSDTGITAPAYVAVYYTKSTD